MIRYDLDQIIVFDKSHKKAIKELLNNKIEAYLLPSYDEETITAIIAKL